MLPIGYNLGLNLPSSIAIDGSGNVWATNNNMGVNKVVELSNSGVQTNHTGGGISYPTGIAIDVSGNAWVANGGGNSLTEISSSGTYPLGPTGLTGGGLNSPYGVAIDGLGNIWVANPGSVFGQLGNSVTKFSSSGTILSGTSGYTSGGLSGPGFIAIDGSGNAWISNVGGIVELSNSGAPLSGPSGYTSGFTSPFRIALDSYGNGWALDSENLDKFSSTGTVLMSRTENYPTAVSLDGSSSVWMTGDPSLSAGYIEQLSSTGSPGSADVVSIAGFGTAVDGSGNVWMLTENGAIEFVGAGTPVITPIAAGLPATPTANGSSNLGTRP